jgi:hypothetical protein
MATSPLGSGPRLISTSTSWASPASSRRFAVWPDGVALVDPGPSTTLATLKKHLEARGVALGDIRAHSSHPHPPGSRRATGSLLRDCPNATVFVHEAGARHLIDPSKLVASASRLYGADMERLWGEILPVPAERLKIIGDERLHIAGTTSMLRERRATHRIT